MMSFFIRMLNLIGLALLLALFANLVHPRRIPWVQDWGRHVEARALEEGVEVLPLKTAAQWFVQRKAVFVDARAAEEYEAGHIREAVSLPLTNFYAASETVEALLFRGAPLVFYCSGPLCDDALEVARLFKEMGYEQVYLFAGGWERWLEHDGPVE
jgi:rhodanese-related sulfurtransferase